MTAVDPYIDAESGVLRNRLGITDPQRLHEAEAGLTLVALADLGTRILPGQYDPDYLQSFYREIFGDIYPWAGEDGGAIVVPSPPHPDRPSRAVPRRPQPGDLSTTFGNVR